MDALNVVEKGVDKVLSKLGNLRQDYADVIEKLIADMEGLQSVFNSKNLSEGTF